MMGVPLRRVVHRVQSARDERYSSLRGYFHGASDMADDPEHMHVRLHSVALRDGASAIGRELGSMGLAELGAEVTVLRRGMARVEALAETLLAAGDVVVVRGSAEAVSKAEARLLH
jgi:CPA2 family monovalent cation:H+ antiporter-2